MKKAARIALRILVVVIALVLLLAVVSLDAVDYQPYMRTAYYKETKARLATNAAANLIVQGELFAGFGRARLTPEINASADDAVAGKFREIPLAGYGNRNGRPATGAHDDLFVKAAAIRVGSKLGIMFGVDALIIPREVSDAATDRLGKELRLAREQLYFSASHTHCSLGAWGEGIVGEMFAGKFNPNARAWFVEWNAL
jgi:neutral ceramidase